MRLLAWAALWWGLGSIYTLLLVFRFSPRVLGADFWWGFVGAIQFTTAFVVVLVGFPVVLGALFQLVRPALGRGWRH